MKTIYIYLFSCLLFLFISLRLIAQQPIDVQHYKFAVTLNDANDSIKGEAGIAIKFLKSLPAFSLDLVQNKNGGGMQVTNVSGDNVARFEQKNNKIRIYFKKAPPLNTIQTISITYKGIPADGLIISKNKYGDRTFFADNWPDRARHWLPCNDIPSDKASVEFIVTAPSHYSIISNGVQVEEKELNKDLKQTYYKEEISLPTKVMVIGAANFAVARLDSATAIPVTAWVYPQNRKEGFYDYGVAPGILQFFSNYIAPFPYKKLANVQSKTIFGGMENAGCIFYSESSVTGTRRSEDLIAHEIAHQWFGDMATEKSFPNLWLSEGFSTYMADLYIENKYGKDSANKRLQREREEVIRFSKTHHHPVVDSVTNLMDLLNANSYQKGSWILHMLRNEVGDSTFQKIIQTYYEQYKGSNADTRDFEKVAEKVSGKDLKLFFDQWLYSPGIPKLDIGWQYNNQGITFSVTQAEQNAFVFPIEVAVTLESGRIVTKKYNIKDLITIIRLNLKEKPLKVVIDPDTKLLFEGTITEGQQ